MVVRPSCHDHVKAENEPYQPRSQDSHFLLNAHIVARVDVRNRGLHERRHNTGCCEGNRRWLSLTYDLIDFEY